MECICQNSFLILVINYNFSLCTYKFTAENLEIKISAKIGANLVLKFALNTTEYSTEISFQFLQQGDRIMSLNFTRDSISILSSLVVQHTIEVNLL